MITILDLACGSVFQDLEPKVAEQEGLLMNPHHTDYNVIPYPKTG